jgi:hypothetical protein
VLKYLELDSFTKTSQNLNSPLTHFNYQFRYWVTSLCGQFFPFGKILVVLLILGGTAGWYFYGLLFAACLSKGEPKSTL